jgi:hypothetical protein
VLDNVYLSLVSLHNSFYNKINVDTVVFILFYCKKLINKYFLIDTQQDAYHKSKSVNVWFHAFLTSISVNVQLHAPAALAPWKESPLPIGWGVV